MGALAIFAKEAGMNVCGSDRSAGAVSEELRKHKISFQIGKQDGNYLRRKFTEGKVDWFVYTSALPQDHPELVLARKLGLRVSKRDELIRALQDELGLKMVAVAGTHGKTTTTSMIIWACQRLGIPVSHLVGSTLPYAQAGHYAEGSEFMIYEADEYDRNFLHFCPWLSVITVVDYDHPDIYPTPEDYKNAFAQFVRQSRSTIIDEKIDRKIKLAGKVRRQDASLALAAVKKMMKSLKMETKEDEMAKILSEFPGAGRRFERLTENIYSDYAHHPSEIKATMEIAREQAEMNGNKGVVVVYEPHQNVRQHEVFPGYKRAFVGADKIYWLPTYLVRENPELVVYQPKDFIRSLENGEVAEAAECDEKLAKKIRKYASDNYLVVLMTAGPADGWLRGVIE